MNDACKPFVSYNRISILLRFRYGKNFVPNICLKVNPPTSSGSTSSDSAPEEVVALDLRSPTQRHRQTSVSSSIELEVKVVDDTDKQTEQRAADDTTAAEDDSPAADEILDVESSDGKTKPSQSIMTVGSL